MTVNRGPGVAKNGSVGVTTLEHRLQLAGQYAENAPGVPRSGVLAQATAVLVSARSDMSYDIGPFQAVISRTAAEGVYTPTLTGTTNVPTDDAPATNSRWDLIYVKQNDMAKGDADNLAVVGVVKGTAAASPTKPTGSLPAGAMVLAEARIFALTTATNGGSNTVSQVWRHTTTRGGAVPVRNTTERAEITTPGIGQRVTRLDQNGMIETWTGTEWEPGVGYTAVPPPDAGWTIVGGVTRISAQGFKQCRATLKITRVSGPSDNINQGYNSLLDATIPTAFRPAVEVQGHAVMSTTSGVFRENLECLIGTNGDIAFRVKSGTIALAVNDVFYVDMSWWQ